MGSCFSSNSLFSFTPLHGLAVCGLIFLVCLLFSYLTHALVDFSEAGATFYLMHTLQVQGFLDLSCYLILLQSVC